MRPATGVLRLAALADDLPVFASQTMRALADDARKVAATDSAVLITGESGTGKEVTARYIHGLSLRSALPLVKVDCGALPESLIESELFGHARGAFTGADADYQGKLQAAAGGTLFLDEVAELPPAAQTRLLRFLDSGEVQRVGATAVATVDARVIAATNVDLERAVAAGTLRRDLYFRLNVIRLRIPPLRSRREDIVPLAESFANSLAARLGVQPRALSTGAVRRLRALPLPGNVRELKTIIERVLVLEDAPVIEARAHRPGGGRRRAGARRPVRAYAAPGGGEETARAPLPAAPVRVARALGEAHRGRAGGAPQQPEPARTPARILGRPRARLRVIAAAAQQNLTGGRFGYRVDDYVRLRRRVR